MKQTYYQKFFGTSWIILQWCNLDNVPIKENSLLLIFNLQTIIVSLPLNSFEFWVVVNAVNIIKWKINVGVWWDRMDKEFSDYKKLGIHLNQMMGSSSSIGAKRVSNVCVAFRAASEQNNRAGYYYYFFSLALFFSFLELSHSDKENNLFISKSWIFLE